MPGPISSRRSTFGERLSDYSPKGSKLDIQKIISEYGDLENRYNLDKFIVTLKLKENAININDQEIENALKQGLTASKLSKQAIRHLKKSPDPNAEILYVVHNIDIFQTRKRLTKKKRSKDDIEIICNFLNLLDELKNDNTRFEKIIKALGDEMVQKILEFIADISKYKNLNIKINQVIAA